MTRTHLLGAASAVALICAAPALAQSVINGGGSTLAQYVYGNGSPNATPTPNEFNYWNKAKPAPKATFGTYWEAGSGTGQLAFLSNNLSCDIQKAQGGSTICTGQVGGADTTHYGASDATLSTSQTSSWATSTVGQSLSGNLIQVPTFGTPVTIPVNNSNATTNGAATFSDADLCGIFSGQITDFSQITDSAGLTPGLITVVYRSDGSGTTFLLTNHLAAVCGTSYPITFTATTSFSTLFTNAGKTVPSNFIGESGSSGIANALSGLGNLTAQQVASAVSYLTPDFTTIAPNSTARLSNGQKSALTVASVGGVLPNVANTTTALNNPATGQNLKPPVGASAAANPLNWVPLIQTVKKGYPVVGYTTWDVAQCYADANIGASIIGFLNANYSKTTYLAVQTNNGFVQIAKSGASPFLKAIKNDLLSNTAGFNTNIQNTSACQSAGGSTYAGR